MVPPNPGVTPLDPGAAPVDQWLHWAGDPTDLGAAPPHTHTGGSVCFRFGRENG